MRAYCLQVSGDWERAKEGIAQGIALAEALDHPNSLALALHNSAMGHQLAGDREATLTVARRAAALAERFTLSSWHSGSLLLTSWATAFGNGITNAAQLVEAEIDKVTTVSPVPQYYLGGGRSDAGGRATS